MLRSILWLVRCRRVQHRAVIMSFPRVRAPRPCAPRCVTVLQPSHPHATSRLSRRLDCLHIQPTLALLHRWIFAPPPRRKHRPCSCRPCRYSRWARVDCIRTFRRWTAIRRSDDPHFQPDQLLTSVFCKPFQLNAAHSLQETTCRGRLHALDGTTCAGMQTQRVRNADSQRVGGRTSVAGRGMWKAVRHAIGRE